MFQRYSKQSMQMLRRSQVDAYLTVYLSLSLTVILSLILALLYGARVGAVKMKSELVCDIAMSSALGEYNRELFDRYGLLFIDDSYCSSNGSVVNTREHLSKYFSKNFELSPIGYIKRRSRGMNARLDEVAITGYSYASDNSGAVLKRQIQSYMEAEPIEGLISDAESNLSTLKASGIEDTDVEKKVLENDKELGDTYSIDTDDDGEDEELTVDDPAAGVKAKKSIGVLPLAAPNLSEISSQAVDSSRYISHRKLNHGTGLADKAGKGVTATALFNEYIFEKCGCFLDEREDTALKYELEYIFAGKDSDYDNLSKVVNQLFLWREASNFMYIMTDSDKLAQAEALALTASILLTVPELLEAIKVSIILAWTFAETISDLRILLSGGRVPIIKTAASWKLSIEQMLNFQQNLGDGKGSSGLTYKDYLKMMLLMKSDKHKTMKLMDIMEMNVRKSPHNEHFRLDNCIDTFSASFRISSKGIKNMEIERIYGYEMY